MESNYDIIVIGGGPAGLSAASTIVRQDHKTILFDSGKYRNAQSEHMHTVATWDHRNPQEFREAARKGLDRYGTIDQEEVEIETVTQREDGLFEVTGNGRTWTAKKVVLATGVTDIMPAIPGYDQCWVSGIFHCLYCHGWEEKGAASAGVLAEGDIASVPHALHIARQTLRMSKDVTIYTNGNEDLATDIRTAIDTATAPMKVDSREIESLVKAPHRARCNVHFADGTSATEAFIAHKPKTKLRGNLAQQLGLELTPAGVIKVSPPFNQTSLRGVFAAGDCATPMQTVTNALQSGACTGGGAPSQIQAETYNQKALF